MRLKLAIQKAGRLTDRSIALLRDCGLDLNLAKNKLVLKALNFPIDIMLMRDDDIVEYVMAGACDLGIVGQNVYRESLLSPYMEGTKKPSILTPLGFGQCRLSLAIPENLTLKNLNWFDGKKIATSYPHSLKEWLGHNQIEAKIVHVSGSVEIAPQMGSADAICDLVSTGTTLSANGLKEYKVLWESQSVLIKNAGIMPMEKKLIVDKLFSRAQGVLKAKSSKYIMMNAPKEALMKIKSILPGMESPSVVQLEGRSDKVGIHAVCREEIFWETMEKLKEIGASSVLVLPIEKVI